MFPAFPVPIFIVFALLFVPRLTVPVVPESTVTLPEVPEVSDRLVAAPDVIAPLPAKPKAVAETEMVSREETLLTAPEFITIPLIVLVLVAAVMAPRLDTAKLEPAMTFVPVPVPSVNVPVPFALSVRLVSVVDGLITGLAPEKVSAVDVRVSVLIVPLLLRDPARVRLPLLLNVLALLKKLIAPVVLLPRLNVWLFVVANVPSAVKNIPPLTPAEIDAVGVPELTFLNAKVAEAVDDPPRSKSCVVMCSNIAPFA